MKKLRKIEYKLWNKNTSFHSKLIKIISIVTLSIGIFFLIISSSILYGFQDSIKNKIYDFSGHINVSNFGNGLSFKNYPVKLDEGVFLKYKEINEIDLVVPFIFMSALIEKNNYSDGIIFKGINEKYINRIKPHLLFYNDTLGLKNSIIVSKSLYESLNLNIQDKVSLFFPNEPPIFRKMSIKGIYETGLEEFDNSLIFGDINLGRKIYNWDENNASGISIYLKNLDVIDKSLTIIKNNSRFDEFLEKTENKYSQIFNWLNVLDKNIIVFFIIISIVACFNMISVVLILIMDKIKTIGVLKSFGTDDKIIFSIFKNAGSDILIKALIIGNISSYFIIYLQNKFTLFKLDSSSYYLNYVPMKLQAIEIIIINILVFTIVSTSIYIPTYFIGKITVKNNLSFN
ncbi:MAG: ABC transporter permease [Flammeovirgaceae bacterium TMED290]|nr:MAG: ABC transporter permease [Flammeovirgaceae bacterium TMED290]|tara:strand:+ start:101 stop:1303 length:1203 start_codon:yes stop_codon:yes gene_type:complete